jgi:hypothetical protein
LPIVSLLQRATAWAVLLGVFAHPGNPAEAADRAVPPVLNGFVLAPLAVPVDEILSGGPPRDGIPALSDPETVAASESPWEDDEIVIGVAIDEAARAYPIPLLVWHELVNDTVGDRPILVSYCPLCGSALVFDRKMDGRTHTFGVSGLLYRSDLLIYDRTTESLWSQISSRAVAGPKTGTRLRVIRSEMTRWGDWRSRHPNTTVMSSNTGHSRPYERSPYAGYQESETVHFPVPIDGRYHPKMPTLGVRVPEGPARAYPAVEILQAGGRVEERFEGRRVAVTYDPEDQVFRGDAPEDLEIVEGYWFAWAAFHPSTTVFVANGDRNAASVKSQSAR